MKAKEALVSDSLARTRHLARGVNNLLITPSRSKMGFYG